MRERFSIGLRVGGWIATIAAIVLAARAVAYSFAPPTPTGRTLEGATGGPPLVLGLVACLLAVAVAVTLVGTAAVAISERRRLEPLSIVDSRGIRPRRIVLQTLFLFLAASAAFALFESYLHWRAGLGWHGLHCLTGPGHRDALPFLAALSVVATAVVAATDHVLAWLRRAIGRLFGVASRASSALRRRLRPARQSLWAAFERVSSLGARAPPPTLLVLPATAFAGALCDSRRAHI
jgi:hypothetical protein